MSFRMFRAYLLLFLIVSSQCLSLHNTIKTQNKLHSLIFSKVSEHERDQSDQKQKFSPPKVTKAQPTPEQIAPERRAATITHPLAVENAQQRNAMTIESEAFEALQDFQSVLAKNEEPDWAFRLYATLGATEAFINLLTTEIKKADVLKCPHDKPKCDEFLPKFLEAILTKRIGFEIKRNEDGNIRPSMLSSPMEEIKAVSKYTKFVEAFETLTTEEKRSLRGAISKAIIIHFVKAALVYIFKKILEGTVSLAIPGAGILIAIYKLYKMVNVKFVENAAQKDGHTGQITFKLASIANLADLSVTMEIDFVSATFTKMVAAFEKVKKWFINMKDKIYAWFQTKFKKTAKIIQGAQDWEIDLGENVVDVYEKIEEKKETKLTEFHDSITELISITKIFVA